MAENYYNSGRVYLTPPPPGWEPPQDSPENLDGVEECLPGEDGQPSGDYKGLRQITIDAYNSTAHFLSKEEQPGSRETTPDKNSWRALLYSTQGLTVPKQPDNGNPNPFRQLGTCHVGNRIFAYESHPVLTNYCPAPGSGQILQHEQTDLKGLSVKQVKAFWDAVGDQSGSSSCVTRPKNGGGRDILIRPGMNSHRTLGPAVEKLKTAGEAAMAKGLENFIALQRKQDDSIGLQIILGIIGTALAAIGIPASIIITRWSMNKQFAQQREMFQEQLAEQRRLANEQMERMEGKKSFAFDEVKHVVSDVTEAAKDPGRNNPSVKPIVEDMKAGLRRPRTHIMRPGPSGSGKGESIDMLEYEAVTGSVPRFKDGVRIWEIEAGKVIAAAGAWKNREVEIWEAILTEARRQPTLIILKEADTFIGVGATRENPKDLFDLTLVVMEGKGDNANITFVLDSTRGKDILTKKPDIKRRVTTVESEPPAPDTIRSALDKAMERNSKDPGFQEMMKRVSVTPEALRAIQLLGEYEAGAPPSSHITVLNSLLARMDQEAEETGQSKSISEADVVTFVARNRRMPEAQVRALLAQRAANPQLVQEALTAAFYRDYVPIRQVVQPAAEAVPTGRTGPVAPIVPTGWEEVLTERVDSFALHDALRSVDPTGNLASFFRGRLASGRPIRTVGDLVEAVEAQQPGAADVALALATAGGKKPIGRVLHRAIFELVASSAEAQKAWKDGDATKRDRMAKNFERELRDGPSKAADRRRAGSAGEKERRGRERDAEGASRKRRTPGRSAGAAAR